MGEVASEGRTVLFVSHNMAAISQLCERSILMSAGEIISDGVSNSVIEAYLKPSSDIYSRNLLDSIKYLDSNFLISKIVLNGKEKAEVFLPSNDREIRVIIEGHVNFSSYLDLEVKLSDFQGRPLGFFSPGHQLGKAKKFNEGIFLLDRRINLPRVTKGEYRFDLYLTDPGIKYYTKIENSIKLVAEVSRTETG